MADGKVKMRTGPVVIGGTGGSGTRLVASMLRVLGVDLGTDVNASGDARAFFTLYEDYVNPFLADGRVDLVEFRKVLDAAMARHRAGARGARWGWKNPRSIYLLPLLDGMVPELIFVHVIRNGMHMATSRNRDQLNKHGRAMLGTRADTLPVAQAAGLLWQVVNERAADYGNGMADRYFRLRFEEVCDSPGAALAPLATHLGLPIPDESLRALVRRPPARPDDATDDASDSLREMIRPALMRFGYPC